MVNHFPLRKLNTYCPDASTLVPKLKMSAVAASVRYKTSRTFNQRAQALDRPFLIYLARAEFKSSASSVWLKPKDRRRSQWR